MINLFLLAQDTPAAEAGFVDKLINDPVGTLMPIAIAIVAFIVGWLIAGLLGGLVTRGARKAKFDEALARFFGQMSKWVVLILILAAVLGSLGFDTTALAGLIAGAGLAVGLALQGNLSNFASGVMILFFKPFTLNDRITAGGHTGVVEDIGLFATTMSVPSNEIIIVPNSGVMGGAIINHTSRDTWRGTIGVGLAYGSNIEQAIKVLQQAATGAELVLEDPAPAVAFVNFGASSLDFVVHCWCKKDDWLDMQHNVRVALYNGLNSAGIEIPFDQIVVHQAT